MNKRLFLGVGMMISFAIIITDPIMLSQMSFGAVTDGEFGRKGAPAVFTENSVYVAWWNNKTGNDEVMFRSSDDAGKTFSDKLNLSNSSNAESQDVEIAADGTKVIVTWWERNQTSSEPVMKISSDGGKTFGPLLKLANNGTISSGEE